MSRTSGDDVLKIGALQYLHVLDTNLNTVRVEIGPKTFTRLEHEKGPSFSSVSRLIQLSPLLLRSILRWPLLYHIVLTQRFLW